MITILAAFLISLFVSILLTPLAAKLGVWGEAMDRPDGIRKNHKKSTPRTGGIALMASFAITIGFAVFMQFHGNNLVRLFLQHWGLLLGGFLVFGVGLFDDYSRLSHRIKFGIQIIAASLVYSEGFGINHVMGYDLIPVVSYGVTVFWILLFINAVNLLDGLDGLSAGVCLFCSLTMSILSISNGDLITSYLFVTLSGSLIGFLFYNFNPASVFMGDGGSYFLGYTIAVISLYSSVKTQAGAAMLIPIVAMGVPMFDTFLSPVRRFLTGRGPFKPDSGHIHHMLVRRLGLNVRKTVLLIYLITSCLCIGSLVAVHIKDEFSGIVLAILGASLFLFVQKLGYLDNFGNKRIASWFRDIGYVTGVSQKRRCFLCMQLNVSNSKTINELWSNISALVEAMGFEHAEMNQKCADGSRIVHSWSKENFDVHGSLCNQHLMKVELPLVDESGFDHGIIWLVKDTRKEAISQFTFLKIEQLRRTIESSLQCLAGKRKEKSIVPADRVPAGNEHVCSPWPKSAGLNR